MPSQSLLLGLALTATLYASFVAVLVIAGRRSEAAAVARVIPDCIVLVRRLIADPRVSRRRKVLLVALVGYLAMPFDFVPDFIPVAGQLDDAILVALVLRAMLSGSGRALAAEHWPGPEQSLRAILALVPPNSRRRPS
jgi:uncharacterized membrane protein YkvA (DUF1232 family)